MKSSITIYANFTVGEPAIRIKSVRSDDANDELLYEFLRLAKMRGGLCHINFEPLADSEHSITASIELNKLSDICDKTQ